MGDNRNVTIGQKKKGRKLITAMMRIVSAYTEVPVSDMFLKTRKREIVQARQISMYVAKKYTMLSLNEIGNAIGKKDHATVLHAVKTINNLIETNKAFNKLVMDIEVVVGKMVEEKELFACPVCGGIEIMVKAWKDLNSGEVLSELNLKDGTDCYCNNCKVYITPITSNNYDGKHSMEALPG